MSDQAEPKHKSGHRWVWVFALVLIGITAFFSIRAEDRQSQSKKVKSGPPPVPISTSTAEQGDIGIYLEGLGTVTPVYTVNLTSRVQGQILKVNYKEGQTVNAGDSLLEIDPRPYEAAQMQAAGQLARDQAILKEAQIDLQRYKKAYARNAIAKQQLDDQQQIVLQDQGTVQADQGTLQSAQVNLDYCHIKSPITGKVGLRLVDPGNMVQAFSNVSLVVIEQVQPITVIFSISEDHLPEIQEQLKKGKELTVDLYDRAQQKKLASGKLLTLDNSVDPTTGTVKLKAQFANEDNSLFPNQFVNARLLVDTEKQQTLIPTTAIQRDVQGAFVYVINANQTAEVRPVKVGITNGNKTSVQGVKSAEIVAVAGFDKLQEGAKVTVRNEDASKSPAPASIDNSAPGSNNP